MLQILKLCAPARASPHIRRRLCGEGRGKPVTLTTPTPGTTGSIMDMFLGSKTISHGILLCSLVLSVVARANIVREQDLAFAPDRVLSGELWRVVTGLLFLGKMDVGFLYTVFGYGEVMRWLEASFYPTARAYAWRLFLLSVSALLVSSYWHIRYPGMLVIVALSYLLARRNGNMRVGFFQLGGPQSLYPFAPFLLAYGLGNTLQMKTYGLGMAIGHAVLVLDDIVPLIFGRAPLALPNEAN